MEYRGNIFLLSWDCNGLETVVNISNIEKQNTWALLQDKGPKVNLNHMVNAILLRARYNSQRHYEVYTVTMDDSITEEDVKDMFEQAPQQMADLIRERGNKVYSDQVDQTKIKII